MRRLPLSNAELERAIRKAWLDLRQARLDDHPMRTDWHERLMNEALDELADRLDGQAASRAA